MKSTSLRNKEQTKTVLVPLCHVHAFLTGRKSDRAYVKYEFYFN